MKIDERRHNSENFAISAKFSLFWTYGLTVTYLHCPESRLIGGGGGGLNRCFRGRGSRADARCSGSRSWDPHENARVDESDSTQFQSLTCSRQCASSTSPLQALRLSSRFGRACVARPRATWRRAFRSTTWRLTRADMTSPRLSPDIKNQVATSNDPRLAVCSMRSSTTLAFRRYRICPGAREA